MWPKNVFNQKQYVKGPLLSMPQKLYGAQRIFRAMKILLYDTIMMNTGHYTFVQTHRMYIKSEANVNYRLQMIMIFQRKFINCIQVHHFGGRC